jgi:D-alanyl-D-alanine carboxypeptidase
MYGTLDGRRTLTASLTGGDTEIDLAQDYPKAVEQLLGKVFCGGPAA